MTRPTGIRRLGALLAVGLAGALVVSGCTENADPSVAGSRGPTTTPTSATPTPEETLNIQPKAEVATLAASGPRAFDAVYRLVSRHKDTPDATVRVRVTPRRYRVDVMRPGQTASLLSGRVGLVSCHTDASGQTCLLVGERGSRPPPLFDPGVQRIFVTTVPLLRGHHHGVQVSRAGVWRASKRYGPAGCYRVTGRLHDPGVYCFLLRGRWRGLLARAQFSSGTLSLRHVDARFPSDTSFQPPVSPTPLPS